MAEYTIKRGTQNNILTFALRSSTTGQLLTGKVFGNFTCKRQTDGVATATTESLVDGTLGSFVSLGVKETQIGGVYQFSPTNAALAQNYNAVTYTFTVSGGIDVVLKIKLVAYDPQDATAMGMSRIDETLSTKRAVSLAAGDVTGYLPANAVQWNGGALPTIPGAAPSASDNGAAAATAILANPANKIKTNASNQVETSNPAAGTSEVAIDFEDGKVVIS